MKIGTSEVKSTKTGTCRTIPIELALRPLLPAMRAEADGKGLVLPNMPSPYDLSAGLKRWLATANVDRPSLTTKCPGERPIRFHDLRATGITWMAIRGDEPQKIQSRAGHTSFETTQEYIRESEVLRDGFGKPLAPLPASLVPSESAANGQTPQEPAENWRPHLDEFRTVLVELSMAA